MYYIVVCTDDSYFATMLPHLFEGYPVQVVPINQLFTILHFSVSYSHCIIGLPMLSERDWAVLDIAKNSPVPTFVMVRREITRDEVNKALKLGITQILIDPLVNLRVKDEHDVQNLFDALTYRVNADQFDSNTIFLGCDTYFNTEQHWITCSGQKTQLSDREANILKLFIRYEGKILTKETIANELWNGCVANGGIPKLVGRLRDKLGIAGTQISGRKQGGYIYEKDNCQ